MGHTPGQVAEAASELTRYLAAAGILVSRPDIGAPSGGLHLKPGSVAPWNQAAADVVMNAHAGARQLEARLRTEVAGHPGEDRPGGDTGTYRALLAIAALANAAEPGTIRDAARLMHQWLTAAQRLPAIDEITRWTPIRQSGGDCVLCPYCTTPSLRADVKAGTVACRNPACRDTDKRQPCGRLGYSRMNGDPVLEWQDGLVQGATTTTTSRPSHERVDAS